MGDGKDFGAYTKMVSSMASSGLTGPLLYQTAFNAFSALTGVDRPALLASAEQLTHKLADDRARVLQRHREKLGESPNSKAAPGPLALLQQREAQLQADVGALTQQLTEKSQQPARNPAAGAGRTPENAGRAGLLRAGQRRGRCRAAGPPPGCAKLPQPYCHPFKYLMP
ncbi:hypothetical protein ACFQT0_20785 [Hymenobacter humi]|uniref:Poly(3-hydroxyalkanoate) polymerase subunit PhaE n=1 Tax=Hymenobacter humi TaxID=1411620 RepID=A0ABW2U7P7_9BACT